MDWPARSPDSNAIEHAWACIRKCMTRMERRQGGVTRDWEEACIQWEKSWLELPLEMIDQWIENLPKRLQQIIKADSDNCFHG